MAAADTLAGNPYADFGHTVAEAAPSARVDFIRKTYTHLALAIYAFAAIEWAFFKTGLAKWAFDTLGTMPYGMLIAFGGFILVSWVARNMAENSTSIGLQYAGLIGYVLAQAAFMAPLLYLAQGYSVEALPGHDVNVVGAAAVTTLLMFGGLTAIVWLSGKDFSFMGAGLGIAGLGIMALIVASMVMGFNMGTWFSVGMIVFASAYILYDTSNVMHHYRPGQHVAASLALFASVALLFWYVLRLFMALSSRD